MSEKTAQKTAQTIRGIPFANGADSRRGHGVKGRSGRRPNWLRDFCDNLLASTKCKAQVRAILADKDHPAFATMWKAVGERAHGKPEQPIDHGGELVIRVKREPRSLLVDDN